MFNKDMFDDAVNRSGYKKRHIAKEIGMGYATFLKKSAGVVEWKVGEAMDVCRVLRINKGERDHIFFA